jgi:hypothetical protein
MKYSGGHFTCIQPGVNSYDCGTQGAIINGQVSGSSVSFDMDDTSEPFAGTLSGGSMTGIASTPFIQLTYTGTWTATKN